MLTVGHNVDGIRLILSTVKWWSEGVRLTNLLHKSANEFVANKWQHLMENQIKIWLPSLILSPFVRIACQMSNKIIGSVRFISLTAIWLDYMRMQWIPIVHNPTTIHLHLGFRYLIQSNSDNITTFRSVKSKMLTWNGHNNNNNHNSKKHQISEQVFKSCNMKLDTDYDCAMN